MGRVDPGTATDASIDAYLAELRATYERLDAHQAASALAAGGLLVDTRPLQQRIRQGEVPGALVVERNVLEWRLAPSSPHRLPEVTGPDQVVIVMCSEGFSSTIAAVSLHAVGVRGATDLIGGFLAWRAAGLPTVDRRWPPTPPLQPV